MRTWIDDFATAQKQMEIFFNTNKPKPMKEINIEIPKGCEVHVNQDDPRKLVIRLKGGESPALSYDDVCKKLGLNSLQYFIDVDRIRETESLSEYTEFAGNEAPTREQLESLLALNKLKNVANFLNEGWKPDWECGSTNFYIHRDWGYDSDAALVVDHLVGLQDGVVLFKTEELALRAIEILGEETVRRALEFGSL